VKAQEIRLLDVFFIGPFMMWAGMQSRLTPTAKTLLILLGAATVVYNGSNYLKAEQIK